MNLIRILQQPAARLKQRLTGVLRKNRLHEYQSSDYTKTDSGWIIRLAHENNFMSACRNTYLLTALGAAILIEEAKMPHAKKAAEVTIMMAFLNLSWGTGSYIWQIGGLHRRMHLSKVGMLMGATFSVSHLLMWTVVIGLVLDLYTDVLDAQEECSK